MFKLSLRELFLLVTLAAVGVAWWLDHRRLVSSNDSLTQGLSRVEDNLFQMAAALNAKGMGITQDEQSGRYVLPGPPGPHRSRLDGLAPEPFGPDNPLPPNLRRASGPYVPPASLPIQNPN